MKVIGRIKALLGLDNKKFKKGLDQSKKQTSRFSQTIKNLGKTMVAAFAVKKVFDFAKSSVQAANVQIQAEKKLASQIRSNGKDVQSTLADYKAFASQLQNITTVGDETTLSLIQMAETMQSNAPKEAASGAIALS